MTEEATDLSALLPQVDERTLGEDDMFDVIEALSPVAAKWKAIGTALRIRRNKLDEFESTHKGDVQDCLADTVAEYVRMGYDTKKHGEPKWLNIIKAVEHSAGGNNKAHAIAIAKDHLIPDPARQNINLEDENNPRLLEAFSQKLRAQLEVIKSFSINSKEDEEHKLWDIRKALSDFVKDTTRSKISSESIRKVLAGLYSSDLLVDNSVYEWASKEIDSMEEVSVKPLEEQEPPTKEEIPPLFSKDIVYHACLCSLATSTCTVAGYKDFFNKKFPEHSLEEASLSRSQDREDVDRYLIARQGKVFYVAFQSEPLLSDWMKKFISFEEGVQTQSDRIPLRFFVRQLHDGYRIVFTGFSFGGLLAKAVAARMWREPLLSVESLQENVACITLGAPMITSPVVTMAMEETPQFGSTVHSIMLDSDPIPKLCMFLDPRCEEVGSEVLLPSLRKSMENFQGLFTSVLTCNFGIIQDSGNSKGTDLDTPNALESIKSVLGKALPQLLARLPKLTTIGDVYSVSIDPSKGLVFKNLESQELTAFLEFYSLSSIDQLSFEMFVKHDAKVYQQAVFKSYIKRSLKSGFPLKDLNVVKPSITSVDFRRHGREVSVTVNGDNLWFCYNIQVAQYKTKVCAKDTSQHSLQFNYDAENDTRIIMDADNVKVYLSSHFSNPVKNVHVKVSRKVFRFTFRQEQLAKLTPSELIETAYLSTLLEQHPHTTKLKMFSHRFNTVRDFLEQIVSVVPIESVFHTIVISNDLEIMARCCSLLESSQLNLPPSLLLFSSAENAIGAFHVLSGVAQPELFNSTEDRYLYWKQSISGKTVTKETARAHYQKYAKQTSRATGATTVNKIIDRETFYAKEFHQVYQENAATKMTQSNTREYLQTVVPNHPNLQLLSRILTLSDNALMNSHNCERINAINDLKLGMIYPTLASQEKSPLDILSISRKKLSQLSQQSISYSSDTSLKEDQRQRLSQLYNSKMLKLVNDIRSKDLKMCTLLLGAFMENQIKVPLVKSEFNTAKALGALVNAAAVGVWAMFSLSLGDMNEVIRSIPSGSLLVQVKEYIRGMFAEKTTTADHNYAGKLQFLIQGMDKTVSCNTHYISYSLERQLIELCKKLNISESTPLEVLVRDWDKLFKEDVLSLVVPTHRSLIACWMKWALMIHNLREELAKYTTVGVVGLVNSGKSLLVSTLFNIEVPVGTTAVKRTTIPFLYNLEGVIDGMDVIDFPGVDDRDDTIPDLCELLLALAQVVIFVVDYRKAHTQSAKQWLEMLEDKSVPVLVCLTYADKLYAEHMGKDGSHPDASHIKQRIAEECSMIKEQLGDVPSHEVQLFSFSQDRDSVLNTPEGRERLKDAGIAPPQAVGDWLAGVFESQLEQDEVAKQLRDYVHSK
ncbi:uncharacterized protein LOC135334540 isoform X2 [Halichondria panicea]|uniref:uncharacterized protein LOC135334540 isoform X2 n=1 Tax=Halichondria panicea TaxID=6063 RepID=UPI00312B5496